MTQVDFYILPEPGSDNRERLACRIAEKAYKQGLQVHIHTHNQEAAQKLDKLLWSFSQNSFVPHSLVDQSPSDDEPVHIGFGQEPHEKATVLINLDPELPLFFSRFDRVAEILNQNPDSLEDGRKRFKFYKDRGYPLNTHKL